MNKSLATFAAGLAASAAVALTPGVASAASNVNWSISVGAPGYYAPAPVYPAYGAYRAPVPVYSPPAYVYADPWREREWRRQQWRERKWREQMWRERMWRRQHGYW